MGAARRRRFAGIALACAALPAAVAACGPGETVSIATLASVPETVELGGFPQPLSDVDVPVVTVPVGPTTSPPTTEPPPDPIDAPIADLVDGNRIIVIGDTVFASAAPRSGGSMCDALAAFGWQAEIAAEFGRFVDFGRAVYDARIGPAADEEWDAAAIMLGNHFRGDRAAYQQELDDLVIALAPRPTIVYTLVEDATADATLNAMIRALPATHPNVLVLDWAEIVAEEPDVFVADTASGLTDEGLDRLALFTAATLGEAPVGDEPGCVDPVFTDDSAIVL